MSTNSDLEDEAVDPGYGDGSELTRSSGGTMEGQTADVDTEDTDTQEASGSAETQEASTSESTPTEPEPSRDRDEPSFDDDLVGDARPEWSDRAESVLAEADPINFEPPESNTGLPYIHSRSKPVTQGLEQPGVRVRPELNMAIENAIHNANQYYRNDDFNRVDYFEAAMTVALWHHDEVLALMSEFGYGMKD